MTCLTQTFIQTSPNSPCAPHSWLLVFCVFATLCYVLPCLRTFPPSLDLLSMPSFLLTSLVMCHCVLIWTLNVTFVNCRILWVCHTPSWNIAPKWTNAPLHGPTCKNEPMHSSTFISLGISVPQTLVHSSCQCTPTSLVRPTLYLTSCLVNPLSVFVHPKNQLSQLVQLLGARATLNYVSLRTWEWVSMPF